MCGTGLAEVCDRAADKVPCPVAVDGHSCQLSEGTQVDGDLPGLCDRQFGGMPRF